MGDTSGGVPRALACPECAGLIKNATELPCCHTCLCRPCAYKKIVLNKKKCWFAKAPECAETIQLSQLSPALEMRELIQDYTAGGTKYKDIDDKVAEDRTLPDFIDCLDVAPHKPIVQIKTENIMQEYSELGAGEIDHLRPTQEYSELGASELDLSRVKSEASEPLVVSGEYSELPFQMSSLSTLPKLEAMDDLSALDDFNFQDDLKKEATDDDELFPHPTTLPNTPSSARTEHQSSGYWSDDTFEGPFFGKLQWGLEDLSQGYIECWDNGEMRKAHVSRFEVKCGAESGDLVEFTLRNHPDHGKLAKRVKLVEKALPVTDEDQIKSQGNLKRSLEISAGLSNKKIKTEEVIDAEIELQSMSSSYTDIAADGDETPFPYLPLADIKPEYSGMFGVMEEDPVSDVCICDGSSLSRCGVCPVYFLRSEAQHNILEGESVTLVARIEGLTEDQNVKFVRHLPYPWLVPQGYDDFKLLSTLGPRCIVKKVTPVFKQNFVFVSVMNDTEYQVNISPENVLGVCQSHLTEESEVSRNFIMEPPDRQDVGVLPITVKRKDFSRYEPNHVCGFAEVGEQDMNYKYCLVKISLAPEYVGKFALLKDEMTVQVKRNVWLEFIPQGKGYENLLPKNGVIGHAMSVMNEGFVDELFRSVSPVSTSVENYMKPFKKEGDDDPEAAYKSMMSKLNQDISTVTTTQDGDGKPKVNIIDQNKTFRGVNSERVSILPGRELTVVLFLHSDCDYDPKNLLKMQVDISNNEEFKYYNNCYNIEHQVCKVVNSHCKLDNSFKPSVKVVLRNPRMEVASLPANSSVALVKVHKVSNKQRRKSQDPAPPAETVVEEDDGFSATKVLEATEQKYLHEWSILLQEGTFNKSLVVEEKFPYFTEKPRPKIPFGLKLNELLVRVGASQNSRPTRVLDKISGVFNCTICDTIILDKYSLQDHIYSDKHKKSLKNVQVIAGFEERLFMNRPVVQEYIDADEFRNKPLMGLDHIFEVLHLPDYATYHCALCNITQDQHQIIRHIVSTSHVFAFLKEFFPVAWTRLSSHQDTDLWSKHDLDSYNSIIDKIHSVYGQRKPSIVEDETKLEEAVDRIPVDQYKNSSNRVEPSYSSLDVSFKNIKFSNVKKSAHSVNKPKPKVKTILRIAVSNEFKAIAPGAIERIVCKVSNVPSARALDAKFVLITRNPSNTYCVVKPGCSKIFVKDQLPCVFVNIFNSNPEAHLEIEPNFDIAMVKWKK